MIVGWKSKRLLEYLLSKRICSSKSISSSQNLKRAMAYSLKTCKLRNETFRPAGFIPSRMFSSDQTSKKEGVNASKLDEEAKASKAKTDPSSTKKDESSKTNEEYETEDEKEYKHEDEERANFSTRRKIFFVLGKAIKYSIWSYWVLFAYHFYLIKRKEKPEEAFGWMDMFLNAARRLDWHINDITILLTRPPVEKLLYDIPPLPPGTPYPKTLILGLRGITVHSEYKLGVGFEFKKRPGLNTFIQRLGQMYELVIFGEEEASLVQEICEALDPEGRYIIGRLGHESTLLKDGRYIKDLSYMNRDVKNIVCIDFNPDNYFYHQKNVIKVPKFEGDDSDRVLLDLMPFLEYLANPGVDVRRELDKYGHENPGEKFTDIQKARRDMIMKQRNTGFGGMMREFNSSQSHLSKNSFNDDTALPSKFKSD